MPAVNRYYSSVAVDTTLSFAISSSDLTIIVGSTAGFPTSYPYTLALGYDLSNEELVTIVGASGTTLTIGESVSGGANVAGRGVDGTNDQAHAAGEPVKHVISARDMTESQAHIAGEADVHGLATAGPSSTSGGNVVGTTASQTLTNKTITGGTVNPTTLQQGGVAAALTTDARFNPVGVVLPYAGSSAPTGYLLCNGASVSRTTYSALFGIVSTTYGSVDGSTFNVPNLQDRVPVGKNATGTFATLGGTGGAETVALTVAQLASHQHTTPALSGAFTSDPATAAHTHTTNIAHDHDHTITANQGSHTHTTALVPTAYTTQRTAATGTGGALVASSGNVDTDATDPAITISGGITALPTTNVTSSAATSTSHTHSTSVSFAAGLSGFIGSGEAHNNLQPYIVLNYIIKY